MKRSKHVGGAAFLLLVTLASVVTSCSRDPKLRRDKFLQSGQQYFDKGDYQAANIEFRRAIQVDPRFAETYYRLAVTDLRLRRWQDAYRSLQKSIEIDSNHVPARLELATLEFAAHQNAKARQDVEIALAKEPNNLNAHLLVGQISISEKDYKQALQEFENGERIDRKSTRLNSSHVSISYAVFCLKKKKAVAGDSGR